MSEVKSLHADQIEGLDDYIQQQVQATIRQTAVPVLEDMEEIRRSPAGMLIRLEDKVDALEMKMDERFQAVDQRFQAVDQRFQAVNQRFDAVETKMDERFQAMDQRFDDLKDSMAQQMTTIKWAVALLYPLMFALLGKLFLMK